MSRPRWCVPPCVLSYLEGLNREIYPQEPKAYVDALLEVHAKNQETLGRSFKYEVRFVASFDKVRSPSR